MRDIDLSTVKLIQFPDSIESNGRIKPSQEIRIQLSDNKRKRAKVSRGSYMSIANLYKELMKITRVEGKIRVVAYART